MSVTTHQERLSRMICAKEVVTAATQIHPNLVIDPLETPQGSFAKKFLEAANPAILQLINAACKSKEKEATHVHLEFAKVKDGFHTADPLSESEYLIDPSQFEVSGITEFSAGEIIKQITYHYVTVKFRIK